MRRALLAAAVAAYMRSPETQAWSASYGVGKFDDGPLFFPVTVPASAGTTEPIR